MIGGFLTDELSWRWILILNGPIAIVAITLVATCVKDDEAATEREQLDWIGIVALSIGLVSLLLALDQAPDWGWGSPRIIGLLVISVLGLSGLVFSQRRSDSHHLLIPRDVIGAGAGPSAGTERRTGHRR